jgi:hypothetical protein
MKKLWVCLLLFLPSVVVGQDLSHLPQIKEQSWIEAVKTQQNKAGYPLLAWKATGYGGKFDLI